MNNTINARIKMVRKEFCNGSNIEFARRMKKEPNTTSNWVRDGYNVGKGVAGEIATEFSVSKGWLLTGDGEMLKKPYPQSTGGSEVVDGLGIIKDFYEIIRAQTSMLKSQLEIKDQQMNGIIESMKTKDQQVSEVISLLKEQIKKGEGVDVQRHVAPGAALG